MIYIINHLRLDAAKKIYMIIWPCVTQASGFVDNITWQTLYNIADSGTRLEYICKGFINTVHNLKLNVK